MRKVLIAGFPLFFVLLSSSLFARRPVDQLVAKYKESPKEGMEIFELSSGTKEEMVDFLTKYRSMAPSTLTADFYKKIVDNKYISCAGKDAQDFYNEVTAFFDEQEGYTTSRSRLGDMRSKGYTLIVKDKVTGKTIKETNTVMLVPPEKGKPEYGYTAGIMTIVTEEDE